MRVQLIHWNAAEATARVALLESAGFQVIFEVPSGPDFLRRLRNDPPAAVVVDLDRLPMQGRDISLGIRQAKSTRQVPIVFTGGEPAKLERIRSVLPDAVYTSWERIRGALDEALAHPPANPVKPASVMAGYAGTPLLKKLGIKAQSRVALVGAPDGFRASLGELPPGVEFCEKPGGDLVIWFVRSRRELERGIARMARVERMWIAWPKKTSPLATDLTQQDVREIGLAAGMVDYKICAIDATWSGLLFRRRNPHSHPIMNR